MIIRAWTPAWWWWRCCRWGRWWWRWCTGNIGEDLRAGVLGCLGTIGPLEHGADLGEGRRWPHHGDEGGLLLEALTKPDEEDVDELAIVDGVAEFTEFVRDDFAALAVDTNRSITLHHVP